MEYNATTKGGVWDDVKKGRSRGHRVEEDEELLIFGYSCKLFRDDEKAVYIDKGKHLIPWMGNPELMIDRFDVRGALYDLREAETKGKPFEETATEVELKEEEICEQERYLALYHDENLMHIYQEEEAKRLQSELIADGNSYYQVGFEYAAPVVENASHVQEGLPNLPLKITDPISSVHQEPVTYNPSVDEDIFIPPPELNIPEGMEVPTTIKQNKVIVKTAKFVVSQGGQMEIVIKTKQAGNSMFNFLAFDNGLNAYYKHLVHTIRNGRYKFDVEPTPKSDQNDQYLHPNLSQSVKPDLTPGALSSPSRPSPHCAYSKLITKIREKQIASALEDPEFHSPIAPLSPVTSINPPVDVEVPQIHNSEVTSKASQPVVGLVDYPSFNQTADGSSDMEESEPTIISKRESFKKTVSRLQIHDYSHIKWPPPDIQMVIDKMASYIIKNGSIFEDVVRSRNDQRFMFLKKDHEYHPYYQCKMQLYKEVYGDIFKNSTKGGKIPEWKKKMSGSCSKKESNNDKSRTISFSIKSREQEVSVTSHTTFPIESSTSEDDEEMDEEVREQRRLEREKRRQERKLKAEKEKREREEFLRKERMKREEEKRRERMEDSSSGNEDLYDIFKYAQEMEQEKNKRSISPEGSIPPSKQEERKKKAAVFLSKLKDTKDDKKIKSRPVFGPQLPPEISSALSTSVTQSPASSRTSSDGGEKPPPLPIDFSQPPPPPPRSPSPMALLEQLNCKQNKIKSKSQSRDGSVSPAIFKQSINDNSSSTTSVMITGVNEFTGSKGSRAEHSESVEKSSHRSRSHKKQARLRSESESRSSSTKRDRKKRKRSHYRHKKHRSKSRSRSREHSKPHRSSHKKKQKHSSHKDKDKSSRKKKHRRRKSPSSDSSLPSSDSSTPSTPSSLPSESDIDEVQVIESDDTKASSRGSSVISVHPNAPVVIKESNSNGVKETTSVQKLIEGSASTGEDSSHSPVSLPPIKSALSRIQADETANLSNQNIEIEKRTLFDPNTSSAMAKITQGLRAKLNALLEKGSTSKLE